MEQAHADELSFVMNALDDVPVHLQLGDDGGGEGNPGGVQFSESDWLVAGLAQSIQHQLLLRIEETHRPDCRPPALTGAAELSALRGFGVLVESRLAQCERRGALVRAETGRRLSAVAV